MKTAAHSLTVPVSPWAHSPISIAVSSSRAGLLGTRQHSWSRNELRAIRVGRSGIESNDRAILELQIHPATGKQLGMAAGRDEAELRWVAAVLRRALDVPTRPATR